MLKIIKASEAIQVKTIIVTIYGPPFAGKTSTGFSAARPLLIDADAGAHRSRNRRDVAEAGTWHDIESITPADMKDYDTIVVDTVGRALDLLTADIIDSEPKNGRGGTLTLQGYGVLKGRFASWLKMVRGLGKDVVLLAHNTEEKDGDDTVIRLDIQGSSKNEIYKVSDAMGRLSFGKDGGRILSFDPSAVAYGKNPAHFPPFTVPNYAEDPDFLGRVIAMTKASINERTAAQTEASNALDAFKAKADACIKATDFDELITVANAMPGAEVAMAAKLLLVKAAKAKGLEFHKEAKAFGPISGENAPPKGETPTVADSAGSQGAAATTGASDAGEAESQKAASKRTSKKATP